MTINGVFLLAITLFSCLRWSHILTGDRQLRSKCIT